MVRETIRKWVAYIIGAALTTIVGISCLTATAPVGPASPAASSLSEADWKADFALPAATAVESQVATEEHSFEYEAPNPPGRFQSAVVSATVADIAKNPDKEVHIAASAKPQTQVYEVTAYFLNVRTNAYPKSKIKSVVAKGTRLEIVGKTTEGWLRIKGGGYVHGDYANLVEDASVSEDKPKAVEAGTETIPTEPAALAAPATEPVQTEEEAEEQNKVPVVPTSKVETESGLSEEDIARIFKGTDLAEQGLEEAILEVEKMYGINALFTIAVMKLESGNGSSRLAKNKNNLFGLNATGPDPHRKAFAFEKKGDSVKKFGQLLADKYVDKGYTTIEKIATKYCPANSKWPSLVKTIMKKDYKKLNII